MWQNIGLSLCMPYSVNIWYKRLNLIVNWTCLDQNVTKTGFSCTTFLWEYKWVLSLLYFVSGKWISLHLMKCECKILKKFNLIFWMTYKYMRVNNFCQLRRSCQHCCVWNKSQTGYWFFGACLPLSLNCVQEKQVILTLMFSGNIVSENYLYTSWKASPGLKQLIVIALLYSR